MTVIVVGETPQIVGEAGVILAVTIYVQHLVSTLAVRYISFHRIEHYAFGL